MKLCICIPTYNRLPYLKELVSSVEPFLSPDVGLAISDNGSSDGTAPYLHTLQERYPQSVRINISQKNLGPDRNYQLAVATASAEFCWLMGSDDRVSPDAIPRALRLVESGADIVVSSRVDCTLGMREIGVRSWFSDSDQNVYDFRLPADRERFFKNAKGLGALFSYLSTTIFRKSSWDSVLYDGSLDSSAYSHAYILLEAVFNGARIKVVPDPLVMARGGNDHFLQSGEAKRILLDIDGYAKIARMLSEYSDPDLILRTVRKEQPWWRIAKLGALLKTTDDLRRACRSLKAGGYSSLTVFLTQICYAIPWPVLFAAIVKKSIKTARKHVG
jgi:abequosyltransferase